jgi:hypothetical protein
MKKLYFLFIIILFNFNLQAQVEKVIVETYYITDINDATDTTGGGIEVGAKTYRIYVDLKAGSKLKKVYGDINHPLIFSSTSNFFNNKADGQSFAKDFSKNRYSENTVALDSWITLGQTTKISSTTNFGVLKYQDDDGSFIGGSNNDGGSQSISSGLLNNNNSLIGIPITVADGMDTMTIVPTSWGDYGFIDLITGNDSTIFGSIIEGSLFKSYNAGLFNSGVTGVNVDSNQILIAQLTTLGELSFELNLEVEENVGGSVTLVKYVANDSILLAGETISANLKYPPVCGCKDANYLEYSSSYGCNILDSCKTLIVFGCADPMACNYNPNVNFNLPELCCYIGNCNDLDISIVCADLSTSNIEEENLFEVFPNPTQKYLNLKINNSKNEDLIYNIFDSMGRCVIKNKNVSDINSQIDVSLFPQGVYLIKVSNNKKYNSKIFIKN